MIIDCQLDVVYEGEKLTLSSNQARVITMRFSNWKMVKSLLQYKRSSQFKQLVGRAVSFLNNENYALHAYVGDRRFLRLDQTIRGRFFGFVLRQLLQ